MSKDLEEIAKEVGWVPPYYRYPGAEQEEQRLVEAVRRGEPYKPAPIDVQAGKPLYDPEKARYAADQCCTLMASAIARVDEIVVYEPQLREWKVGGVDPEDGTWDTWSIKFCPWCGTQLPKELSCEWVDEHQRRGLPVGGSTADEDLPEDMKDDRWWKAAGL